MVVANDNTSEVRTPREIINSFNEKLAKSGKAPGLEPGERAPNFSLKNQYEKTVNLNEILLKDN